MSLLVIGALLAGSSLAADTPSPWTFTWASEPVGPDGPWNALFVPVDNPMQNLTLLPSLTQTSLFIWRDACLSMDSTCPALPEEMWTNSTAHSEFIYMNSEEWNASSWDDTVSAPLDLQGTGIWMHEMISLWSESTSYALINQVASLTEDFTVHYPGGANYTMDVGFFSLYGAQDNLTWTSINGSSITLDYQLPSSYSDSSIPSNSFGLHIGSPTAGIDPSLILGGYDRSRCISDPIASDDQTFELTHIEVGVEGGDWAFSSGANTNLLTESTISVMPNPGVPYLYLPQGTCDAIAKNLPVTYSSKFGLYLWNTSSDSTFEYLVSSPSYLSLTLQGSSSGSNTEIKVPFALLNLTLETPLVTTPTQYFPCSPYSPSDNTYHLGRAFLQAALLAQNWNTNTTWLAQAPGPDSPSTEVKQIDPTSTTLSKTSSSSDWISTWNSTLTSLSYNGTVSNSTGSSGSSGSTTSSSSSLSGGAIAGIVVGVVAVLAIIGAAAFFFLRRRKSTRHSSEVPLNTYQDDPHDGSSAIETEEKTANEANSTPIFEVPSPANERKGAPEGFSKVEPVESGGHGIAELPANEAKKRYEL